jgi:NADPH:quinone reductase-like Zn-dependent oxidoreductase
MMRALLLNEHAHRPQTHVAERADDPIGGGEIRVQIEAAALNPLDAKIATGAMADWFPVSFPYVPGTDFAGVVEEVGPFVSDFAIGDRVFGRADPQRGGAVADSIVIDASLVARCPESLSAREAACLPTPAGVALQVLEMLERSDEEPLLILGEGMVARMATALAGDAALQMIEVRNIAAAGRFRHVIDTSGGALQAAVLARLSPGSQLVALTAPVDAAIVAARGIRADFVVLETARRRLDALATAAAQGILIPHIDYVVALDDAALAFERYVARDLAGKIVIEGARR